MHTAQLDLHFVADTLQASSDALSELLACWYKNGQISISPSPFALCCESQLQAFVSLPEDCALQSQFDNDYVRSAQAKLQSLGANLCWQVLGFDPASLKPCACAARSSAVMYTYYLATESPIRCGDCFLPVPLYRLPHTRDKEYFDWLAWANDYRACDRLQMNCTVGERYHERQLSAAHSELNRSGLALRTKLAELTQKPVFYYLHKTRGVSVKAERKRRCPSCKAAWLLDQPWHSFDFRCEACGLVSRVAHTLEG
jgi:predicted  nucleic acid-binding Zn ribbon protein